MYTACAAGSASHSRSVVCSGRISTLWAERHGSIHELVGFGNVVPTGLERPSASSSSPNWARSRHLPEDGKVVAVRAGREPREAASGTSMLIDVEWGPHGKLYGLSQAQ